MPYIKQFFFCAIAILALLLCTTRAHAQAENFGSPYSRFGLGDLQPFSLAQHRAMGGITTTFYDSASLNLGNPASLSDLKLTNIEFGTIGNIARLQSNSASQYRSSFNLGYAMLGFPVSSRWGTAIGFQPYAFTNYNISSQVDSSFGNWREDYNGRGGINQVSWSNGFALGKGFHLGLTVNYLFGTINQERLFIYPNPDSLFLFNVRVTDQVKVNDLSFSLGMQYRKALKPKGKSGRAISVGLVAELPAAIGATNNFVAERFTYVGTAIRVRDTVANQSGIEGDINLPLALAFGLQYSVENKFVGALEAKYTNWSDFSQFGRPDSLQNSMQFAAGFQYTPKYDAIGDGAFFKTIRYRAGLRYHTGMLVLRDQQVSELGMTFGVGIPTRRMMSRPYINFTAELGQRGSLNQGLVRERYVRMTLGFTLNDRWFIKRKYD
ncbi:MAG: hypothetical protein ACK417_09920 [Bacteroidia bacterium]|jgi:hypothetical protein